MSLDVNILITRPRPYGVELCRELENEGFEVSYLPTIEFKEPPDPTAFHQGILALPQQKWIIFNSREAVNASVLAMKQLSLSLPPTVKLIAVGEATAKALREAGYTLPICPKEWSSEGLLNLPELQSVQGKKIAIIKGEGGREMLAQTLSLRGAEVFTIIAYQRRIPTIDATPFREQFIQGKIDFIVGTSYECILNLKIMLGETWDFIRRIPLVVVSDRIKRLAHDLGYKTIWVARNASHIAILDVINEQL